MKVFVGLKLVRRIAVVGAIVGVILLWIIAHFSEVPVISVAEIDVNHNMALVRIRGTVAGVRLDPEHNRFSLSVDDGSGRINLSGFDKLERFQHALGDRFPRTGDEIEVRGNLSISDQWGVSMFLTTPNRLTLVSRPEPVVRKLGEIRQADLRKLTTITATVAAAEEQRAGVTVVLHDDTGEIPLTLFNSEMDAFPSEDTRQQLTTPGNTLRLTVMPVSYRDDIRLQLADPSNPDYIALISAGQAPPAEPVKPDLIESILLMPQGKIAFIDATVESARKIGNAGYSLTVSDSSGMAPLVVFNSDLDQIRGGALLKLRGTRLRTKVKVSSYRNELQLQIQSPAQAEVTEGGAP